MPIPYENNRTEDIGCRSVPCQVAYLSSPAFCYLTSARSHRVPHDSTHRPHAKLTARVDPRDHISATGTFPGPPATADVAPSLQLDARPVTRLDPKKMMPNTRDFPPLTPFAASVVEGKRRLPLSDTENLMVGAFGGTLECTVQSECPGPRSRYIPPTTTSAAQTTTSDHPTHPARPQSQCPSSR